MILNRTIEKMGFKRKPYTRMDKGSRRQTQKEKIYNKTKKVQLLKETMHQKDISNTIANSNIKEIKNV